MADLRLAFTKFYCFKILIISVILLHNSQSVSSLICYCQGHCPLGQPNGTCLAQPNSRCFAAVEQVYNPDIKAYETDVTFGCLPPDETGLLQCKGQLVPHQIPKGIICCSDKDLCNKYLQPIISTTIKPPVINGELLNFTGEFHYLAFVVGITVCVICAALIVICMVIKYICRLQNQKKFAPRTYLDAEKQDSTLRGLIDQSVSSGSGSGLPLLVQRTIGKQIELCETIGKGRYGEVRRGRWRDEDVAVKIFLTSDEVAYSSWAREKDVYQTVLLRHDNILGFIAADTAGNGAYMELLLITDYHERGSLHDFLKKTVLDLCTLLKLAHTAASGITHLHVEVFGKQGKPAIAHRDIKSKNILVKRDLTCAIADFGLAVRYKSENGELDKAPSTRVGTKRYMAPEILDNTFVSEQFEAYKMADMYAFALVLWELTRRCSTDTYIADDYQLPYYNSVPSNPGFEDMRKIVCCNQQRPAIPSKWKSCEVLDNLSKVMQECWKQTPGARLSALRVKKTLSKLRSNKGMKV